jgi:hypothetical protein
MVSSHPEQLSTLGTVGLVIFDHRDHSGDGGAVHAYYRNATRPCVSIPDNKFLDVGGKIIFTSNSDHFGGAPGKYEFAICEKSEVPGPHRDFLSHHFGSPVWTGAS